MVTDALTLVVACFAGGLVGAFFFGGLWWTVRALADSPHPARLLVVSLLLRTGVVLAGFYFVSAQGLDRLLACLFGFIMARVVVMRLTREDSDGTRAPLEVSP